MKAPGIHKTEDRGKNHPRSVFLTVVSAACMVAIVMVLIGILERRSEYRERFGELGTSVIWLSNEPPGIWPSDEPPGTRQAAEYAALREVAERLDHVSKVFAEYVVRTRRGQAVTLLRSQKTAHAMVHGVDEAYIAFRGYTMKAGRFLRAGDRFRALAVLSEGFAEELGGGVHDRVRLWGREFEIVGIVAHPRPRPFSIGRVHWPLLDWQDVFVPFEIKRQEIERQFAAGEMSPLDEAWADLHLVYTPSRQFAIGRRAAIVDQAEKLLQEAGFGPRDYRIGEQMTAYGYVNFNALAFGGVLLFLFGVFLWTYARSLRSFFALAQTIGAPAPIWCLLAASAIGGVSAGLPLLHLLMEIPPLPAAPVLLSMAVVLPLQSFMAKRVLRKLPA